MEPQYKTGRNWWPGLKILDRYIIRKFLGTYVFAIAMIIVVVVIFDYVEKIDGFTQTHAPLKSIIFDYYLNFVPFFVKFFDSRLGGEVGNDLVDSGLNLLWQIAVDLLTFVLTQLLSQFHKQELKLLVWVGSVLCLGDQIPDLLLGLFLNILPQAGL